MNAITATTGKSAGNAARVRQRLLAAFLPVSSPRPGGLITDDGLPALL